LVKAGRIPSGICASEKKSTNKNGAVRRKVRSHSPGHRLPCSNLTQKILKI
jgi:hypothetical protein